MTGYWLPFALSVLLVGCAAQVQPPRQYLLDYPALAGSTTPDETATPTLLIEAVRVAAFLDASGIVFQTDDNQISAASGHLWAEPLARQLRRALYAVLTERLENIAVFEQPPVPPGKVFRLTVSLDAFQGRYDGDAVIAGIWRLAGSDGQSLARRRFRLVKPLPADGYPPLVQTLSSGWREVGGEIADTLAPRLTSK